jgi:ABC-type nitrate/sulfonate/bicarbonate transport system permease component
MTTTASRGLALVVAGWVRLVIARIRERRALLIGIVSILIAWLALSTVTTSDILPGPVAVASRAVQMIQTPYISATLQGHMLISFVRVIAGFTLGCVIGLLLGLLMYFVPIVGGFLAFALALLRPIPPFTLIAVFVIWFGLGETPKIVLIFFGVFARMALYVVSAFRSLPNDLYDAGRSLGAGKVSMFMAVRAPAALPDLFIGMRILMALAWTSVMGAELITATSGIGWAIWTAATTIQTDVVFVGVIAIAIMGGLMDAVVVSLAERITGGWAARVREA